MRFDHDGRLTDLMHALHVDWYEPEIGHWTIFQHDSGIDKCLICNPPPMKSEDEIVKEVRGQVYKSPLGKGKDG